MIEKPNGHCDVKTMNADGVWNEFHRDIANLQTAWGVARANILRSGCRVWYCRDSEPDSTIRPY
jgi:hypothetical protein